MENIHERLELSFLIYFVVEAQLHRLIIYLHKILRKKSA